jgi:hypothetical protein
MSQELQVIQDCYDLSVLVLKRVQQFPRNQRYGLGRSIESRMEWILALMLRAKYSPRIEKDAVLRDVNIELEVLRFQIRQAVDLKAVPQNGQHAIVEKLMSVGQQVGGWRKSVQSATDGERK